MPSKCLAPKFEMLPTQGPSREQTHFSRTHIEYSDLPQGLSVAPHVLNELNRCYDALFMLQVCLEVTLINTNHGCYGHDLGVDRAHNTWPKYS